MVPLRHRRSIGNKVGGKSGFRACLPTKAGWSGAKPTIIAQLIDLIAFLRLELLQGSKRIRFAGFRGLEIPGQCHRKFTATGHSS
jgi:hypothetical protein